MQNSSLLCLISGLIAAVAVLGGCAGTLMRGLLRKDRPDSLHRAFVERCLRERGYDPIGWR